MALTLEQLIKNLLDERKRKDMQGRRAYDKKEMTVYYERRAQVIILTKVIRNIKRVAGSLESITSAAYTTGVGFQELQEQLDRIVKMEVTDGA